MELQQNEVSINFEWQAKSISKMGRILQKDAVLWE